MFMYSTSRSSYYSYSRSSMWCQLTQEFYSPGGLFIIEFSLDLCTVYCVLCNLYA